MSGADVTAHPADATPVPSPCTNVCRMNAASGCCEGCYRTIDEIVAWGRLDDAAKRAVWRQLELRRAPAAREPAR
ncbi:MAG: DUF1289 domain-containing protein [Pseudomonadota bacterium]